MATRDGYALFLSGALIGAAVTAALAFWHTSHGFALAHKPKDRTQGSSHQSGHEQRVAAVGPHDLNDEIVKEHLARNVQFFGEPAMRDIAASYVVVVGLGGVGSHAAHMLLRSGVGHLLLIDFDQVRTRRTLPLCCTCATRSACA